MIPPDVVPIDEIERPITEIRNQTLLYSIALLVLALPMYVTLVVAWIDRRLENRAGRLSYRDMNSPIARRSEFISLP
jgi:hypothetical protein